MSYIADPASVPTDVLAALFAKLDSVCPLVGGRIAEDGYPITAAQCAHARPVRVRQQELRGLGGGQREFARMGGVEPSQIALWVRITARVSHDPFRVCGLANRRNCR
jgi:hypothetical protein